LTLLQHFYLHFNKSTLDWKSLLPGCIATPNNIWVLLLRKETHGYQVTLNCL
jgi:hypothetical protein